MKTDAKNGVLQGRVTIGPICSVERIDKPCEPPPEMYASHKLVVLAPDGKTVVQEIKMDSRGYYKADVAAGDYLLDFLPHDIGIRKQPPEPVPVHIDADKTTTQDLAIDTGMR